VNTKRDWLICGQVALDKCNVFHRACCPPRPATYINKQHGGTTRKFINYDFPSQNLKEKKNTQQATEYADETVYVGSFNFKLLYTIEFLS
jgi:hypothetical protein